MNDGQCFICKSWMDENQLIKGDDGFVRCYEHAYLNQETLIAALREAGEKMADALRDLRKASYFTNKDAAALAEWEAANK